jgi:hypothetical protein
MHDLWKIVTQITTQKRSHPCALLVRARLVPDQAGAGTSRALTRERGCAWVYWHTHSSNETARRLYDQVAENRGFIQYLIQL